MPPRKRARVAAAGGRIRKSEPDSPAKPSSVTSEKTPERSSPAPASPANDLWTDDEETQLFKSIMQYKPTGVYRHIHMLSIAESMRSHGYTNGEHTRIPGIWAKLESMYDLEAMNEREDRHSGWVLESSPEDEEEEDEDEDEEEEEHTDFEALLPRIQDDEFTDLSRDGFGKSIGDLMWERRFTTTKSYRDRAEDGEDEVMKDADEDEDELLSISSPEVIEDLRMTRSGLDLELPSRAEADAAYAASVAAEEEERASKKTKGGRAVSSAARIRGRATRSTPLQETEEDEAEDDDEDEDESTAAGSPPAGRGARGATRKKQPTTRGRGRKK